MLRLAKIIIARHIVRSPTKLTPEYLTKRGWIEQDGYFFEPGLKDRDRISISFDQNTYRVWHSNKLTFIAMESSVEWFDIYYLMAHPDNGRYELANV